MTPAGSNPPPATPGIAARFGRHWRIALFATALASLPFLWSAVGSSWLGTRERVELDAAQTAYAEARYQEAWSRAEGVLGRCRPTPESPEGLRQVAASAALLSARARLEEMARERVPVPSRLEFAAWRATQAEEWGADPVDCRRIRMRAAQRMREVGLTAEAIAELERLNSDGRMGDEGERELAIALAGGGEADRERALPMLTKLLDRSATPLEAFRTRMALGRAFSRMGRHDSAVLEFHQAAELAVSLKMQLQVEEARLEEGTELIAVDRLAEAGPALRELLRHALTREVRERAGVMLPEVDAATDEAAMPADLLDLRDIPAAPESLFAARARVASRRLRVGRRSDAAAGYAAAFDYLKMRPYPEDLHPSAQVLKDLQDLEHYGLDANDLPALARAAEGLALCLPESEPALELAAGIAARRAGLADERRQAAEQANAPAEETAFEARALHGKSAELYLTASDSKPVVKSRSVDNRMNGARELFRGGFWETARPVLDRLAQELDPTDDRNAEANWMRARTMQELGRHQEAVAAMAKFLKEHRTVPTWSHEAFFELARSQEALGNFEAAEAVLVEFLFRYDNVTPQSPRWGDALFALGDLQARIANSLRAKGKETEAADRAAQAERNLADAIRRFPTAYAQRFRAEYRLGLLAMARHDWQGAAARFRAALSLPGRVGRHQTPDSDDTARRASLLLGECLYQLDETSDAIEALGQAWTSKPRVETVLALRRLADCHERLGDARQAERFRQRAEDAMALFRAEGGAEAEEALLQRLVADR